MTRAHCVHLDGERCSLGRFAGRPSSSGCSSCADRAAPGSPAAMRPEIIIDLAHLREAARALASAALPPLDDEAAGLRLAHCQACEHRWAGDNTHFDPVGWCRRCGCGSGPAAALSRKARLRGARCPIGRWDGSARQGA